MASKCYIGTGKPAVNILENGSLSKNYDGWTINGNNAVTQNNGYLTITGTAETGTATGTYPNYQMFEKISGSTAETTQLCYACVKVRGRSANISYPRVYFSSYTDGSTNIVFTDFKSIDGKTANALNDGDWHTLSSHVTTFNASSGHYWDYYRIAFGISGYNKGDVMDIKEVYMCNLTETFGRGNEPDKAWCDQHLTNYGEKIEIPNSLTVARRVKKGYIGVTVTEPVYEISDPITTTITSANIGNFFTVNNGSYYFKGSGSIFTTNNAGVSNSTAQTTLTAKKDMQLSFQYSYSTEANYDTFSLTVAGTKVENEASGSTTSKSWSGNLTQGQTIIFTYSKDGSQDRNDDACSFSNMQVTAVEKTQIGTVEKMLAKKIKKGYLGIGGVARPFWGEAKPVYYGAITPLSAARDYPEGVSIGNYALFAGGNTSFTKNTVDAYNTSLTRSTPSALSEARDGFGATAVGNYAILGGGRVISTTIVTSYTTVVDAYNRSLTRSRPDAMGTARCSLAAATVGNHGLFAGGHNARYDFATVDVYSSSLTTSLADSLSYVRSGVAGASVGDHALFAGGVASPYYETVDAYNTSLTKSTATSLSSKATGAVGLTMGDYAIFGGGSNGNPLAVVNAYNRSLTRTRIDDLSLARASLSGAVVNGFALFGGGRNGSDVAVVDAYDVSLTRTTLTNLSIARSTLGAASVGNYVLFAGGDRKDIVDAYLVD